MPRYDSGGKRLETKGCRCRSLARAQFCKFFLVNTQYASDFAFHQKFEANNFSDSSSLVCPDWNNGNAD